MPSTDRRNPFARRHSIYRHALLSGTALTLVLLADVRPASAVNECGAGATATCTSSGNPFAAGITYSNNSQILNLSVGVAVNASNTIGVWLQGDGTQTLNIAPGVTIASSGANDAVLIIKSDFNPPSGTVTVAASGSDVNVTGLTAYGYDLFSAGAIDAVVGNVTGTGNGQTGVYAQSSGGPIGIVTGNITMTGITQSLLENGINAINFGAGANGAISINTVAGEVKLTGASTSHAITIGGAGPQSITTGNVSTISANANAINASTSGTLGNGTLTVDSTGGTVTTAGSGANGIFATNTAGSNGGTVTVKTGVVTTLGSSAAAIRANSSSGGVNVAAGNLTTSGSSALGVNVTSKGVANITTHDIHTSGNTAHGVQALNTLAGSAITIDSTAGTIATTGIGARGIAIEPTVTANVTIHAGTIDTTGNNSSGIHVYNNAGAGGAITITAQSIVTHGNSTAGFVAGGADAIQAYTVGNLSTDNILIDTSAGAGGSMGRVEAFGDKARGIIATSNGGTVQITAGDVTTHGNSGNAIEAESSGTGANGAVTVNVLGRIETFGAAESGVNAGEAGGVEAVSWNNGNVNVVTHDIFTRGNGATGIDAQSSGGTVTIDTRGGTVTTLGAGAIAVTGTFNTIGGGTTVLTGNVHTAGNVSIGVAAFAGISAANMTVTADLTVDTSAGTVFTEGTFSAGLNVIAGSLFSGKSLGNLTIIAGNVTTLNSAGIIAQAKGGRTDIRLNGPVTTGGSNSHAVTFTNYGTGNTTISVAGSITTAGATANGLLIFDSAGGQEFVDIAGKISATGASANGVYMTVGNTSTAGIAEVTVHAGASVTGGISGITMNQTGSYFANLYNYGTITGLNGVAVDMEGGPSLFQNSGTVNGNVFTAGGGDIVYLTGTSITNGFIDGGASFDVLELAGNNSTGSDFLNFEAIDTDADSHWTVNGNISGSAAKEFFSAGNASLLVNGIVSGGALTKSGNGTLILAGVNTYTGGTTIAGGTLQLGNGGLSGSILGDVANSGIFAINNAGTFTFAGNVSGSGALLQNGTGTTILTGNHTYTGGTTIASGKLVVGNGGTTGWILGDVTDNGSFGIDRSDTVIFGNAISGTGAFEQRGSGTTILINTNTYSGGTQVLAGTLQIGNGSTSGSIAGNAVLTGTLAINRSDSFIFGGMLDGGGAFRQIGTGTTILTGDSPNFTGTTTIAAGTLQLGNGGTTGSLAGAIVDDSVLAINHSNTLTLASAISGSGSLNQIGTGTTILTANNSYSGGTTISAGTLQLGNGGASGSVGGNITDNGTLALNRSGNVALGNTITGSGIIQKLGNNTVTLSGSSGAFAGTTQVNAGTLLITGALGGTASVASGATLGGTGAIGGTVTVLGGGHIAPGTSPGTLTISGNLILNSASVLDYELATPNVVGGGINDLIAVGGNLTLGGMLNVANAGGFGNGTYTLITYAGALNDSGLLLGSMPSGFVYGLKAGSGEVDLIVGGNVAAGPNQYWDGTHSIGNGAVDGGNGTWTAGATNWTDAGGVTNTIWGNQTAIFTATPGTVSVVGPITFTGMRFLTDGYTIVPGSSGVLTTTTAASGMFADTGATATISAAITGSGGLDKTGAGTIVLLGNHSYSGGTVVDGGTLQLGRTGTGATVGGNFTVHGGVLDIVNADTSGIANITVTGGSASFYNATTAGTAVIANAGTVNFFNTSSAANANITNTGTLGFSDTATAASASIVNNSGGNTLFAGSSSAGSATITDNSGGTLYFQASSDGAGARVFNNGGGKVDISLTGGGVSIGSIEGAGNVFLGSKSLTLGATNLASAEIGGIVADGGTGCGTGGSLVKAGTGTLILSGNNTYTGTTTISGGTLQLGNGGASGSVNGNITDNGLLSINHSNTLTIGKLISGSGSLSQIGNGTTVLTGANTYGGGTTISAGTLQLGNGAASGSIAGNVTDNGTFAINRSDAFTFGGRITGTGAFRQIGTGATIFTADHSYSGGTAITAGSLALGNGGTTGSIAGNVANSGTLIFNRSNALVFAGVISGSGGIAQNGSGVTTLSATNSYTGATMVNAGTLSVNGSIASSISVTVNAGATLAGTGTVGSTGIAGGTLSPGNSIGTLAVSGALTIAGNGTYLVEVSPSAADLTTVTGTASVSGTLQAIALGGTYTPGAQYTLIDAAGGVSGTFSTFAITGSFGSAIRPRLAYDANHVYLALDPNAITPFLADPTPNQESVAEAIDDAFGSGNAPPEFLNLFALPPSDLNRALSALSGEIHASLRTAALDDSRFVRQAVMKRLGSDADMGGPMAAQGDAGAAVWGQVFGSWAGIGSDGNAADFDRNIGGFLAGIDASFGGMWRLGVAAGYSRSNGDISPLASSSEDAAAHLAAYAGATLGPWRLRAGAANSWNDFTTERVAAFPGFTDHLRADYSGRTTQGFGEIGYSIVQGPLPVEPFAGISYVNLHTDAFHESGGAAVLAGPSHNEDVAYSTLGVRTGDQYAMLDGTISVHGSAAWQHGFGMRNPKALLAFAGSGSSFFMSGVPLAEDSALLEIGAGMRLDSGVSFSIDYSGQVAPGFNDSGVKGYLGWRF